MTNIFFPRIAVVAAALALAGTAFAQDMTKDLYSAEKDRIAADYKAAKASCDPMSGNAKDMCRAQAQGTADVAKAELEARYRPGPKNTYNLKMARADADYRLANGKCNDAKGHDQEICSEQAKDVRVHAKADAEVQLKADQAHAKAADTSSDANQKAAATVADARHDAAQDKRDADYALAKAKCDALSGAAQDTCVSDAKTQFAR
jgi:hypothetical protein